MNSDVIAAMHDVVEVWINKINKNNFYRLAVIWAWLRFGFEE